LSKSSGNDDRTKLFRYQLLFLFVIDRTSRTEFLANLALSFCKEGTMLLVDHRDIGNGLTKRFIDGLSHSQSEVPFTRHFHRALFDAEAATCTLLHIDVSGLFTNRDIKVSHKSLDIDDLSIGH